MSTPGSLLNAELLIRVPERFPAIRLWRNNRVKAKVLGTGGRERFLNAGVNGQGDLSGIIGPSGRRLEIETKAGKDRLNEAQKNFCAMIRELGGVYVVARTAESGLRQLAECLQPGEGLRGFGK